MNEAAVEAPAMMASTPAAAWPNASPTAPPSIAKANERVDVEARGRINKEEHAAIYEAIKAKDIERAAKACGGTSERLWDVWA
jgi:hypothetical protein